MGLDYSFMLYLESQDPWRLLEGVGAFADPYPIKETVVLYPDRRQILPFESWAGTEDHIMFDDDSEEWNFMTSLYLDPDEALTDYVDRWEGNVRRQSDEQDWNAPRDEQQRVGIGYIYLTVYNSHSGRSSQNLIQLQFAAATTSMSILFCESISMRRTFIHLLEGFRGVYGLIDRENDAVVIWFKGKEMDEIIPYAGMPLNEIEDYLGM